MMTIVLPATGLSDFIADACKSGWTVIMLPTGDSPALTGYPYHIQVCDATFL
jgi:hypothetical protein